MLEIVPRRNEIKLKLTYREIIDRILLSRNELPNTLHIC